MDEVKRKLTFNQSSNENTKKLRNRSISTIENLSNEFFYEIFDYLDGFEIYEAFSNLNHRFQKLINSSSLLFKIKFHRNYKEAHIKKFQQILLLNRYQIFSMNMKFFSRDLHFFSLFTFDSTLSRLESIAINSITQDILMPLLINLSYLPRLFSLFIHVETTDKKSNDIYQLILALPMLKYNQLSASACSSFPMATDKKLSTIEYLIIDHPCNFNELASLISYTPQLRYLRLYDAEKNDLSIKTISPMKLPNLTYIYMFLHYVTFDELEIFIREISSKLKILCITRSNDPVFFDAHRWEQSILQYFPGLEKFYLTYYENVNDNYQYPIYSGGLNLFCSSFWIERQWIFAVEIDREGVGYSVRPYRKSWYEDKISNSSTKLTITYVPFDASEEALPVDIQRVLTITQIYHLEISEENLLVGTLSQLLRLLPDLITLQIYSLSLDEIKELCDNECVLCSIKELCDIEFVLFSIKDRRQVTKVYLEKMNEIQEFYLLLMFCPNMAYFKVGRIINMDVKLFLRRVFETLDHDCNAHLRSLVFRVPAADDQMVKSLHKMINDEKLCIDYSIKRALDDIYLQWK